MSFLGLLIVVILLIALVAIGLLMGLWFLIRAISRKIDVLKAHASLTATISILSIAIFFAYDLLSPRSGDDIYKSLFDHNKPDCVKILKVKDAMLPVMDNEIWVHAQTCPEEINRLLSLKAFESQQESTTHTLAVSNWFNPKVLGDSMWVHEYLNRSGGQIIYTNTNQTEMYCVDYDF